jgi:hypothetical protein
MQAAWPCPRSSSSALGERERTASRAAGAEGIAAPSGSKRGGSSRRHAHASLLAVGARHALKRRGTVRVAGELASPGLSRVLTSDTDERLFAASSVWASRVQLRLSHRARCYRGRGGAPEKHGHQPGAENALPHESFLPSTAPGESRPSSTPSPGARPAPDGPSRDRAARGFEWAGARLRPPRGAFPRRPPARLSPSRSR